MTLSLGSLMRGIAERARRGSNDARAWLDRIPPGEAPPGRASVFGTHIALNRSGCPFTFLSRASVPETVRFHHGIMSWKTPDAVYTKHPGLAKRVLLNKRNPKSWAWYRFHHRFYNYRIPADLLTYTNADDPHVPRLRQLYTAQLASAYDENQQRIRDHIAAWVENIGLGTVEVKRSIRVLNAEITHLMLFGELPRNRWFARALSAVEGALADPKRRLAHLLWPFLDRIPTPYTAKHRFRATLARYFVHRYCRRYLKDETCVLGRIHRQGIAEGRTGLAAEAFPLLLMAVNAIVPFPMMMSLYLLGDKQELQERIASENIGAAVIKEILRLYPPVPTLSRVLVEPVEGDGLVLGGTSHPDDQFIMNHTAFHRDPRGWTRPDEFVAERWLPGWTDDLDAEYRLYIPFGLGARSCPGAAYATSILNTFLDVVISKRVVSRPPDLPVHVEEGSIRAVHGTLNVHFAERTRA